LDADHLILIPPETSFSSHAPGPIHHFYLHFLTSIRTTTNHPLPRPITQGERRFLTELTATPTSKWNRWKLIEFLAHCLAHLPEDDWHSAATDPPPPVKRALSLIHSRLPSPTPTAQLAREVGMNVNAFIRLFRQIVGSTPAAFQKTKRIELACILLHHREDSIDAVAETCGFCDRHHFSRVFKAERGISPARFRANFGDCLKTPYP